MSNTYFIRGTISIRVEGGASMIGITPCAGFLTPDKPQKAIAFPVSHPKDKEGDAKLIKLSDDKQFECDAQDVKEYLSALLSIAAQQKPVELHLTAVESSANTESKAVSTSHDKIAVSNEAYRKITGFVFSAP